MKSTMSSIRSRKLIQYRLLPISLVLYLVLSNPAASEESVQTQQLNEQSEAIEELKRQVKKLNEQLAHKEKDSGKKDNQVPKNDPDKEKPQPVGKAPPESATRIEVSPIPKPKHER